MLILMESITGEAGIEPAKNPDSNSGGFANVAYSPIKSCPGRYRTYDLAVNNRLLYH
jgi:hypothetical protein